MNYADNLEKTKEYIDAYLYKAANFIGGAGEEKIIRYVERVSKINFFNVVFHISKTNEQFLYWNEPALGYSFIAIGSAFSIKNNGTNRTSETEAEIARISASVFSNEEEFNISSLPLFLGGLKFAPNGKSELWRNYSDSDWFIPKTILLKRDNQHFMITTVRTAKAEDLLNARLSSDKLNSLCTNGFTNDKLPKISDTNLDNEIEYSNWKSMVESALESIREGKFQKIVLSREIRLTLEYRPEIYRLLKLLSERYPYCYIFAYRKGESIFLGASPERLAKFAGGFVEADALAGSIPRGRTLEEDRKLETDLLNSAKNLHEQKAVVDFIANSFKNFASEIKYEKKPIIRKLPNIQHLWTPIRAKLNSDKPIFSFLKEVHPTPAICGAPWSAAMNTILDKENHHRGLFTGAIGWFNLHNEGEFAVAIRSALLKGNEIYAFAGCGIVEGSDPITEFEETKLKLRPILNLFDYEEKDKS